MIERVKVAVERMLGAFLCRLSADGGVCPCCLQDTGLPETCSGCGLALTFAESETGCPRCDKEDELAEGLAFLAEQLVGGMCGCDRARWSVLPCGHCACKCECDGCPENLIWRVLTEWEQVSWCGCDEPGKEVLSCGHCACGNGLCVEFVSVGDDRPFEKRLKASCA